mgnify:CR=1 FL=1
MATTEQDINDLMSETSFGRTKSEEDLSYKDVFATNEQKKRDKTITGLLSDYALSYKKKVKHSTICRYVILVPCILIIVAFAIVFCCFAWRIFNIKTEMAINDLAAFITACISFVSLIIGLLTIVTKYFFPENDEQYVTTIVESIQKNDLENKRENAKHQSESDGRGVG